MQTSTVKPYDFPLSQDQYLTVNKTDLIQSVYDQLKLKLSSSDIKILKDGLQLQLMLGTNNKNVSALTFKQLADMFTSEGVEEVTYDDQVLKMWVDASPEFLFVDSGDDKLQIVDAGVDAPAGTIQVTVEEGHVYTLLYSQEEKINEAITQSLALFSKAISTRPMTTDRQVDDHRISILRKKFGMPGKGYNDRVKFVHPKIQKLLVHV